MYFLAPHFEINFPAVKIYLVQVVRANLQCAILCQSRLKLPIQISLPGFYFV